MVAIDDLTGRVFSRWTVLYRGADYVYRTGKTAPRWVCSCCCGKVKLVHGAHLKNMSSTSCGCYNREITTKHGMSYTKEYKSWSNMIKRCTNPSKKDKAYYGHCEVEAAWLDFNAFIEDIGNAPEGFELDRIDNTKGYSKTNCRWASQEEQSQNRGVFSNNTSGKTGVSWSKDHGKWRVYIHRRGVRYEGGLFADLQEAIDKRLRLEEDYFKNNTENRLCMTA